MLKENNHLVDIFFLASITPSFSVTPTPRPVSFTTPPGYSASSGRSSVSTPSSSKPTYTGSSASGSATAVAVSATPSAAAGTSLQVGTGAFFGAVLAAVLAL